MSNIPIRDETLIGHIRKRQTQVRFMKDDRVLKKTLNRLKSDTPLPRQTEICHDLWKQLFTAAMLHLRKNDKREHWQDEELTGENAITRYYDEWCDFENLLYASYQFYRDHTIHTLRNYILGDFLLTETGYGGYEGLETSTGGHDDPIFKDAEPHLREAMWCVISLAHDLGEPLPRIKEINKQISKVVRQFGETIGIQEYTFSFPAQSQILTNRLLDILSSRVSTDKDTKDKVVRYYAHRQPKIYIKLVKAFENYNQALMSALLLYRSLTYFEETDYVRKEDDDFMTELDALNFVVRREILRAVACHDIEEIFHVRLNQFALFLILVDEMQEWDRPVPKNLLANLPTSTVNVKCFTTERVHFTIKFDDPMAAREYYAYKTKRFRQFLRYGTAVDPDRRMLVRFDLDVPGSKERGIFIHRTPKKVDIYSKYGKASAHKKKTNAERISWLMRPF